MISQLYIENIAVIKKISVDFHSGLNVFTGETGAGKSILINSIGLATGKRAGKEIIRNGTDKSTVMLQISDVNLETVKDFDVDTEDDSIIIQRDLSLNGRNNCKVNSKPVSLSILKDIGTKFIDLHGQNESYSLLSKNEHLGYIDSLANNGKTLEQYRVCFKELVKIKKQIEKLEECEENRLRDIEILNYDIEELENADITVGELDELKEKRDMFSNYAKIVELFDDMQSHIQPEVGIGINEQLDELQSTVSKLSEYFIDMRELSEGFESLCYEVKDCLSEIISFSDTIAFNPQELERIDDRIDMLNKLSVKYQKDEKGMLDFLEECRQKVDYLENLGYNKEELKKQYKSKFATLKEIAQKLTESRKITAEKFSNNVCDELKFLNMEKTIFSVSIEKTNFTINGCDDVEFRISTNPGEPLKPLSKIASGGELSRIMLAIKTVIADHDHISTLIFDEIDTGISGEAATKVGKKLLELSKYCQVICITHLAQIAACADAHFLISKNISNNEAITCIKKLDIEDRKKELARIISGDDTSKSSIDSATEMLKLNGNA